jgi:predicted acyl esterase
MRRSVWLTRAALIIAAVLVLGGAIYVVARNGRKPTPPDKIQGVRSDVQTKIPVGGGVSLVGEVITPKGSGRFPLVVMPTAFGAPLTQYHGFAGVLARDGYQVVTYVQRGFHESGGKVDFADTPTQRDVSSVISWALAHAPADADHVGLFGTSYGAGVSLLGAARDTRVKAVVATSGWSDFGAVFDENNTTSASALPLLLNVAANAGKPAAALQALKATLLTDPARANAALTSMARTRSAAALLPQLNAHHPAIMLASGYADSVLPPESLISFYDKLTGPKRFQLAPGDHGSPEYAGLLGQPNPVTTAAHQWLDHYLKGTANGIDRQDPVQLQDVVTHAVHGFRSWPTAATALQLGRPNSAGDATEGDPQSWTADIDAGADTAARSGPSTITSTAAYQPPRVTLAAVGRDDAYTWTGAPVTQQTTLAGLPRLALTVTSSTGSASLFAYLYDVDPAGTGLLMSVTPYTATSARTPTPVTFPLSPVGWTLAAGHRLGLVIDTMDARWRSVSRPGSTVTLSSSSTAPATLTVPISG